jgi:hypothetical protein
MADKMGNHRTQLWERENQLGKLKSDEKAATKVNYRRCGAEESLSAWELVGVKKKLRFLCRDCLADLGWLWKSVHRQRLCPTPSPVFREWKVRDKLRGDHLQVKRMRTNALSCSEGPARRPPPLRLLHVGPVLTVT